MDSIVTFKDIYTEVGRNVFSDKPTDVLNYKLWANMGYLRVIHDVDYPFLRQSSTFTSVAGTRLYVPEPNAIRILNMRIPSLNRYVTKRNIFNLDVSYPRHDLSTTARGIPFDWYDSEWVGVQNQPVAASAIRCISSASEPVAFQITVEGIVSGEVDREQIQMSQGPAVAVSTTKLFTRVDSITKSSLTTGRITCTSDALATTNAVIGPLMKTRIYRQVGLNPTPNDAFTFYYKFIPWLPEMVNDSDAPRMPERDRPVIIDAAMLTAAENLGDTEVVTQREKRYADKLAKIHENMKEDDGEVPAWTYSGGMRNYQIVPGDFNSWAAAFWAGAV